MQEPRVRRLREATSVTGSAALVETSATREQLLLAAERLCARDGFHAVSVRDITSAAGANVAAVHYHFGSKDDLLLEIFRIRARELNRERLALLSAAADRHGGEAPAREVLEALVAPPVRWLFADDARRTAIEFVLRVRTEGTPAMWALLRGDLTHLQPFVRALRLRAPDMPDSELYWSIHFCLGLVHNNRPAEFERLHRLSRGLTRKDDADRIIGYMVGFAVRGLGVN